jgi:hypothetical protein
MRTAADNFVGASVRLTWENEKLSFWVGVRSFLICGKSFGGGKLGGDNKVEVRWEGILEEAPGHRCIYTHFQS